MGLADVYMKWWCPCALATERLYHGEIRVSIFQVADICMTAAVCRQDARTIDLIDS